MKAIIKRNLKNYLKNPIFWTGLIVVLISMYQTLAPYLSIHYVKPDETFRKVKMASDGDVMEGCIPATPDKERELWEKEIVKILQDTENGFGMSEVEAEAVISEMKQMKITEACQYLKTEYHFNGANYVYEDVSWYQGCPEEVNRYIRENLEKHPFSYYFGRKFTDFASLHMAFFATVLLAFLFFQDMRKNTYELLHTKPMTAFQYIAGKISSGFLIMTAALVIMNIVFIILCYATAVKSGFAMNILDFVQNSILYVLPNILMICCVYAVTALLFKNPLPAVPALVLYIIYSNMLTWDSKGQCHARPFSIMVRFPGNFFETELPHQVYLNQLLLVAASILLMFIAVWMWKRRRVY